MSQELRWDANAVKQMKCWAGGRIEYYDAFGYARYTNFRFVQGDAIPGTDQFQMVYDVIRNDAD